MAKPWFDAETGALLLDEYVMDMPSFKKIMEDGVISDDELAEQAHKVVSLLQQLESMLTPQAREAVTQVLCELAVLTSLQHRHLVSG